MARRRAPGSGGPRAVAQSLLPILLQDRLMRRRQAEDDMRQTALRMSLGKYNTAAGLIPDIASGKVRAQQVPPEFGEALGMDLSVFEPAPSTRAQGVMEDIGSMKSPADLTPMGVIGRLEGAGLDSTPGVQRIQAQTPEGGLPSSNFMPSQPPIFDRALGALKEKQGALEAEDRAKNLTKVESFDPTSLTSFSEMVPTRDVAKLGGVQTSPSPEQRGEMFQREQQAGPLDPVYLRAKADADNMMEVLTRGEKVTTAGQTAGAQEGARQRQTLAPWAIDARVEEANRKAQFAHDLSAQDRVNQSTAPERAAAMNVVPLLKAHGTAQQLETGDPLKRQRGARIGPMMLSAAGSPTMDWLVSGLFSEQEKQYMQAAIDYANTYGYIRSGVTVRQDEFPRYLSNLFALSTDTDQQIKQKQATRTAFNSAMQVAMGRSKQEGGRALGRAIQAGIVPPDVVNAIAMDPEFQAGVLEIIQPGGGQP